MTDPALFTSAFSPGSRAGLVGPPPRIAQIRSRMGLSDSSLGALSFDALVARAGGPGGALGASALAITSEAAAGAVATALAPTPFTDAVPAAPTTSTAGQAAVDAGMIHLGVPYLWGGTDPEKGFDCSGLIQDAYRRIGVEIPKWSRHQATMGVEIASIDDALPGDIVAFGEPVNHVGLYVGDGKMLHAPRTGDVVKVSEIDRPIATIRRIVGPDGQAPVADPVLILPASAPAVPTTPAAPTDVAPNDAAPSDAVPAAPTTPIAPAAPTAPAGPSAPATPVAPTAPTAPAAPTAPSAAVPNDVSAAGPPGSAMAAPGAEPYRALFLEAGTRWNVDPALLAAVAQAESAFRPDAVSPVGAQGLMQFMPATAAEMGVDPWNPASAIDGAARYLRRSLDTFGEADLAIASYNAGRGAVSRHGGIPPYRETRNYVQKVLDAWKGTT